MVNSQMFFKEFRLQEIPIPLQATDFVDRTLGRTDIFLSLVVSHTSEHIQLSHADARGSICSQELRCLFADPKSHPISQHVSQNTSRRT